MKSCSLLSKWLCFAALLLAIPAAAFSQTLLEEWPFSMGPADSAAVRAAGVVGTVPTFTHLYVSTVTATVPTAYSGTYGEAFGANSITPGDGQWKYLAGVSDGPGPILKATYYQEFLLVPAATYTMTVDSFYLTAGFFNTTSGTTMMGVYSLSHFRSDSTNISGYTFSATGDIPITSAYTAGIAPTGSNQYRVALGSGAVIAPGDTLTIRFYFTCGSTSPGRYACLKNVMALGSATTSACLAEPAAFTVYSVAVCQGATGIVYTVPNDPLATSYTWSYSGTGATFTSTANSVSIDYGSGATSGTLSVISNAACGSSPRRTIGITVNSLPSAGTITGTTLVCSGSMVTLADGTAGGSWSSSNLSIATVSTSGAVTGITPGIADISYTVINGCGSATAYSVVTVGAPASAGSITGVAAVCVGSATTLSDAITGGIWSSSNTSIASVSAAGVVTGVSSGTVNISYALILGCGSASTFTVVTVNSLPYMGSLTGADSVGVGASITLSDTTAGGTWSSSATGIATVSISGIVTGIAIGAATITYSKTNASGCTEIVTRLINVSAGTTNNILEEWPFSSGPADSAAVRAAGVVGTVPTFGHLYVSTITATVPAAYSGTYGEAFGANSITPGDGQWRNSTGVSDGPGATLKAAYYQEFLLVPAATYTMTVDSFYLTAGFFNTTSGTTMMGVYSKSHFRTDSTNISGYTFSATGDIPLTAMLTASASPTSANQYGVALGSGVAVAPGDTLTMRFYFTCSATSPARYACLKDVMAAGSVVTSACIAEPAAFTSSSVTVCQGATGVVYTVPVDTPATSYTWSYSGAGATFTSTTNSVAIDFGSSAASGTLSVIANGTCGSSPPRSIGITVNSLPSAGTITGTTIVCSGSTVTLSDGVTGGGWSSSSLSIATVSTSGAVTGITSGIADISYTVINGCGSATAYSVVTVGAPASAGSITGVAAVCVGSETTLSDAITGGAWSSSNTSIASVSAAGVVIGVSSGTLNISYTLSLSCGAASTFAVFTVNALPYMGSITGAASAGVGASITLSDTTAGGTWSSSATGIATVSTSGIVTGIAIGTAMITYSKTNASGCTGIATSLVHISSGTTTNILEEWTFSSGPADSAAVRASGVTGTIPVFSHFYVSTVTATSIPSTLTDPPAYSAAYGEAFGANSIMPGDGQWRNSTGLSDGPGATLKAAYYQEFLLVPAATYTMTVDSFYLTAGFFNTTSGTTMMGVYSLSHFRSDSTNITGYTFSATGDIPITQAYTIGITPGSTDQYGLELNSSGGVTVAPGDTLTMRFYFSCASTSAGRYACLKDVIAGGTMMTNACIAEPAAFTTSSVTVCQGATGVVYTVPVDTPATSYTWSYSGTGATFTSTTNSVSIDFGISATSGTLSVVANAACGSSAARTIDITVNAVPSAGTITGSATVYLGGTTTLSDAISGGFWSSSDISIASIGESSGVVSAVSAGVDVISYSFVNSCGTGIATSTITVTPLDGISGHVLFTSGAYIGNVKVWLITYNPATFDIEAMDSVVVYSSGTSAYYQFLSEPTDSFRIKAATDTGYVPTGYIPTYHTSSFHWSTADVLYHTAGSSDINQDIDMGYGSVATGPGFIAGNVTTGAGKGTSADIPVVGLLVFVINTTTGTMEQQTYTNSLGNYAFNSLPTGTIYEVYPEDLNYATIAYTDITLTSAATTMTSANFTEHTSSHTITPILAGVNNVPVAISSVITYPNPTAGTLNIHWQETVDETGTVIITDVTGQEIYNATLNMSQGSGTASVDLSAITNGLYTVTIRSGNINYNGKIQVLR